MLPIFKILCPTDFSEASFEALNAAIKLALHFKAKLCLVHVIPPATPPVTPFVGADPGFLLQGAEVYARELLANAEKQLREIIDHRITPALEVQSRVGIGDAAAEIVQLAETEAVDVIVISTHGVTGWRHLVFGSVAEKVVRLARRPVLVIPVPQAKDES
jgi:nucleotide-binding universal stress UspA family protein